MILEDVRYFAPAEDKFYSRENIAYLKKAAAEMDAVKNVHPHELIEN